LKILTAANRDWRDPSWTGLQVVQSGIETPVRQQRLSLFGKNEVDIEGKSTISLLVDEVSSRSTFLFKSNRIQVIHPFYVFQIASIILWSLDNYYYYAFCIALISVSSITTTLIETKKVADNSSCFDSYVDMSTRRRFHECVKCLGFPAMLMYYWMEDVCHCMIFHSACVY
jgi:cation-transporting ATPase 13A3/4/5